MEGSSTIFLLLDLLNYEIGFYKFYKRKVEEKGRRIMEGWRQAKKGEKLSFES